MGKSYWLRGALAMLVPVLTGGQTPTSRPASQQPQQTPPEPPSIAVLDFDVIGSGVDLAVGEALASVIQSALVRGGGLRVIERSKLTAVLTEQDLQVTDLVDPSTAVEIGRIAGVDLLVLGNLAAVEDTHTVTCRVIDVTTGEAGLAEEFELNSLDKYPQLGRLLAALIGEQAIGSDSIAAPARWTETFDGPSCKLKLGISEKSNSGALLDDGRYVMVKATPGSQYSWIPGVKDRFYVQVDLVQVGGSSRDACGLVWGARDTDAYLGVWIDSERGLRLERRQGGTKNVGLMRKRDWARLHKPPRSNRLRLESWDDRHRVFVNGACLDEFYDPGYRSGRVGLRVIQRQAGAPARWAVDNLTVGAIDASMAGIATETADPTGLDTKKKKRIKPVRRTAGPWAKVNRIWVTREVHRKVPGILVHAALELGNCKGASLRAVAQFFDARTDEPLENRGRPFFALGGRVVSERSFSPRYRFSTYGDFGIFIPRAQLRLPRGKSTIKCRVILLDDSRGRPQRLAGSDEVTFTVGG